jgi:4-oxalocrotonate tautomerase
MPLVQVTMISGRTTEQKHALIKALSDAVSDTLGTPLERVRVAIYEVSPDEWGIGGVPHSIARGSGQGDSGPGDSGDPNSP